MEWYIKLIKYVFMLCRYLEPAFSLNYPLTPSGRGRRKPSTQWLLVIVRYSGYLVAGWRGEMPAQGGCGRLSIKICEAQSLNKIRKVHPVRTRYIHVSRSRISPEEYCLIYFSGTVQTSHAISSGSCAFSPTLQRSSFFVVRLFSDPNIIPVQA